MNLILKHTGFILLLSLLGIVYIHNTHRAEGKLRKIAKLKKEVSDAKSRFQEVKSDINFKSTESQLAKQLEESGLKKNDEAPILIEITES